jgi:CheY-like chemotaxis protein
MKTAPNPKSDCTVSVVDDDAPVRRTVCAMIQHLKGFVLAGAFASDEEALPRLKAKPPKIVLLDLRLGAGMSGFEVAKRLLVPLQARFRSDCRNQVLETPVIIGGSKMY